MTHGSYLLIEPGMAVYSATDAVIGTVRELVADENADIFRGIVLTLVSAASGRETVFVPGEHITAVEPQKVLTDLTENSTAQLDVVDSSPNA